MHTEFSPIAQFRSKIEWYLEGNTPKFSSGLLADLVVALKVLASDLGKNSPNIDIDKFIRFCDEMKVKALSEAVNLTQVVDSLRDLLADESLKMPSRRPFRDAVVQLILVAESFPDLSFRRKVLDLAKSIR